jgi:hypothetical protein
MPSPLDNYSCGDNAVRLILLLQVFLVENLTENFGQNEFGTSALTTPAVEA